jgi:hypothetical protein
MDVDMEVARAFCTKGNVLVLEQNVNDDPKLYTVFWSYLSGNVANMGSVKQQVCINGADDQDDKKGIEFFPVLYKIIPSVTVKLELTSKPMPVGPTKALLPQIP